MPDQSSILNDSNVKNNAAAESDVETITIEDLSQEENREQDSAPEEPVQDLESPLETEMNPDSVTSGESNGINPDITETAENISESEIPVFSETAMSALDIGIEETDIGAVEIDFENLEKKLPEVDDNIISIDAVALDDILFVPSYVENPEKGPIKDDFPGDNIDNVLVIDEPEHNPEDSLRFSVGDSQIDELILTSDLESVNQEVAPEDVPQKEENGENFEFTVDEGETQENEENATFNFDLSAIPDVENVNFDEPIALSLEELNNIDISEITPMDFTPSEPAMPETGIEEPVAGEPILPGENIEVSSPPVINLEELSDIQKEIKQDPEKKDEKSRIISEKIASLSPETKDDLKTVLLYLDAMMEDLPEERIRQFANSEYYDLYIRILDKLGI